MPDPPRVFRVSAHSAALAVTAAKEAILSPQRQAPGEILRSRCRSGWHPGDHRLAGSFCLRGLTVGFATPLGISRRNPPVTGRNPARALRPRLQDDKTKVSLA